MNRDEQIDWFLTLLKGEQKDNLQRINYNLKKLEQYEEPSDSPNWIQLQRAEAKRDTYDHILSLAKLCFK